MTTEAFQGMTDRAAFREILRIFQKARAEPIDFQTIDACMRWLSRGRTFLAPE
jgi:hypothetical protein